MSDIENAYDIDTDALVANLRELADGIEAGEVFILGGEEGLSTEVNQGGTEFKFSLRFNAVDEEYANFYKHGDNL